MTTSPQSTIEQPITASNGHLRDAGVAAAPSVAGEGPLSPGKITLTLGLILTIGGVAFETLAVATILPAVVGDLGGLHLYGWAFSAFLLAQLVGIVVAGLLADGRGPALPFAIGVLLFAAGLLVGGLAPTMLVLILGRALQGLGGGAIGSIAYVSVGRGYSEQTKAKMLALLSTAWVVPGLVGPGLAGIMAEGLGWRSVFLLLAPLPILSGLLAYPSLRRMSGGTPAPDARARTLSALVLAGGAGIVLTGIAQPNPLLALPLAAAGLALTVSALRRLLPEGTLRALPGMPAAVATMGLVNLAFFGVDAFVPLALVDVRGQSIAFAGLALTATTIMWTVGSWVQARTAARVPRRLMTRLGLAILVVTFLATAAVLFPQIPVIAAPAIWAIAGLGIGLSFTTLSLTMLELAEPGQEGDVSASIQLSSVLGSGFGAGIGGAFIALLQTRGESVGQALLIQFVLMTAVAILAFVAARGLPRRARVAAP